NAVFEQDNPMNSNYTKFYQDMHDQQLSTELSLQGSLGLAEMMVEQLMPGGNTLPASLVDRKGVSVTNPQALQQRDANVANPVKHLESAPKTSNSSPVFDSPESFVEAMLPEAKRVAEQLGTQPETVLAQAALETGWGQKVIRQNDGSSSHNLFNIKADS
ncbi:MAG: rod-binding protein, partial [Hormoscilla sp. GUM202]|nr:rod-binding protein [Hormoscilla sp. GUM202]